ncbi:MAG: hypothetical protein ACLR06_18230 [Christensenellaceae bacterium]
MNGTDATDNDGAARRLVVTYNDDDAAIGEAEAKADYQWVTNFILQPGYYEDDTKKAGLDRYNRINERLAPTDGIVEDEAAAMSILGEIGRRSWNNDDGNGCTVHSVVYNLTKNRAVGTQRALRRRSLHPVFQLITTKIFLIRCPPTVSCPFLSAHKS